jgi:hypothetical protein
MACPIVMQLLPGTFSWPPTSAEDTARMSNIRALWLPLRWWRHVETRRSFAEAHGKVLLFAQHESL